MKKKLRPCIAGILLNSALILLLQAYLGQDKYVNLLRNTWITPFFTVPLAIAMLYFSYTLLKKK